MKKDRLRSEINLLSINQEVCKDSVILLTSIEELMPVAQYIDKTENFKSLSKEVEDLEKKVGSFSIPNYDESINHRNLLEISNEIDLLIKDVDKLQEKNELFGDFPTVIYKQNPHKAFQVLSDAESELAVLEETWTQKVNEMLS